jgi:putative oxidoreductase
MVAFIYGVHNLSDVAYHLHNGASSKFLDEITALGVPAPTFFATFAAGGLLSGGLFVGAGLFTRAAAGVLTLVLLGAIAQNLTSGRDPQLAVLYTMISLRFTLSGGGRYSLDALFWNPNLALRT